MKCRHYGHGFRAVAFYTTPMALRIRYLREQRGWTQEHLASLSRMSRSQLAMIEAETRPANTLRLNAIAAALGVPVDDLFVKGGWESQILETSRDLSDDDRGFLLRMAEELAAKYRPKE